MGRRPASKSTSEHPDSSVLSLEDSTVPWQDRLERASRILEVDLTGNLRKLYASSESWETPVSAPQLDPRTEWTLRWLLRNFHLVNDKPPPESLDWRSWVLFAELVPRCPRPALARMLRDHDLDSTLLSVLRHLKSEYSVTCRHQYLHVSLGIASPLRLNDDSSIKTNGTKRRRIERSPEIYSPDVAPSRIIDPSLFYAVSYTLRQLFKVAQSGQNEDLDTTIEHIKRSVASWPGIISPSLGLCFEIAVSLLASEVEAELKDLHRGGDEFDAKTVPVQESVGTFIRVWNLGTERATDQSLHLLHKCFIDAALVPGLFLLQKYKSLSSSQRLPNGDTEALKALINTNAILPLKENANQNHENTSRSPRSESFKPFNEIFSHAMKNAYPDLKYLEPAASRTVKEQGPGLQITVTNLLFAMAIENQAQDQATSFSSSSIWLDSFFDELDQASLAILSASKTSNLDADYAECIRSLLQVAHEKGYQIGKPRLLSILKKTSGLIDNTDNQKVNWHIIRLCLMIDPKVFFLGGNTEPDQDRDNEPPVHFLFLLSNSLAEASLHCWRQREDANLLLDTSIELLREYVRNRNLPQFLELWKEQLRRAQEAKATSGESTPDFRPEIIWEHERLRREVSEAVGSLSTEQIRHLLTEFVGQLDKTSPFEMRKYEKSMPDVVSLDAICHGLTEWQSTESLFEVAQSTFKQLSDIVAKTHFPWTFSWRLWRTLTSILERWPKLLSNLNKDRSAFSALETAAEQFKQIAENDAGEVTAYVDYRISVRAFEFAIAYSINIPSPTKTFTNPQIKTMLLTLEKQSKLVAESEKPGEETLPDLYPGKVFPDGAMHSQKSLYMGCMLSVMCHPQLLTTLGGSLLEHFLGNLYTIAAVDKNRMADRTDNAGNSSGAFDCILSGISTSGIPYVYSTLQQQLVGNFHESVRGLRVDESSYWASLAKAIASPERGGSVYDALRGVAALEYMLRLPLTDLTPGQKSGVFDAAFHGLLDGKTIDNNTLKLLVCLLTRLSDSDEKFAIKLGQICFAGREPSGGIPTIFVIAELIDTAKLYGPQAPDLRPTMAQMCKNVLRCMTQNIGNENARPMMRDNTSAMMRVCEGRALRFAQSRTDSYYLEAPTGSMILQQILNYYFDNFPQLSSASGSTRDDIQSAREMHLRRLLEAFDPLSGYVQSKELVGQPGRSPSAFKLYRNLETLDGYKDLLAKYPAEEKQRLSKLFKRLPDLLLASAVAEGAEPSDLDHQHLTSLCEKLELGMKDEPKEVFWELMNVADRFALEDMGRDQTSDSSLPTGGKGASRPLLPTADLLSSIGRKVESLEEAYKVQLITDLLERGLDVGTLYILRTVLLSLGKQHDESYLQPLSRVCSELQLHLLQWKGTSRTRLLCEQCLITFLKTVPYAVNQWHIDQSMAVIARCSTKLKAEKSHAFSAATFTGVCQIFLQILRSHRKKLGGRYHLILPALQGLLRCLFSPYSHHTTSSEATNCLGKAHAAVLSRILTMLCDPSPAALGWKGPSRSSNSLNDETKRERRIAGQHLHYLIEEFCRCQLQGRLASSAMRQALNPGLWAVMGTVEMGAFRALNAAMDPMSRVVFKSLYQDYQRHSVSRS